MRIGSGFNGVSGSGSRRAKMTHKNRRMSINFIFWSAGCSLLRAEGWGLGISKLQFLIKKKIFFQLYFYFNFWSSKPCLRNRVINRIRIRYVSEFTGNNTALYMSKRSKLVAFWYRDPNQNLLGLQHLQNSGDHCKLRRRDWQRKQKLKSNTILVISYLYSESVMWRYSSTSTGTIYCNML